MGECIVVLAPITWVVGMVTVGEKTVEVWIRVTVVDVVSKNQSVDGAVTVVINVTPSQMVDEYVAVTDVVVEVVSRVTSESA